MIKSIQLAKYDKEIKDIKKKRKSAAVMLISALALLICLCFPLNIELLSIHWKGLGIGTAILLMLLCFVIYCIAIVKINLPLNSALDKECDPEKHIALNSAFLKGERLDGIYASGLIYLGDYDEALPYAKSLIDSNKKSSVLSGFFNKFRCEYFKGEYDLAKTTAEEYAEVLKNGKKMSSAVYSAYEKIHTVIKFMIALADKDIDTQADLIDILYPWRPSAMIVGLIDYLKGVSAFDSDDKEEALYRFKSITRYCSKTVLAAYSREYLSKIKIEVEE